MIRPLPGTMPFRHKTVAALLAFAFGALGFHRLYLRQRGWWLSLSVTLVTLPLLIGVRNWYQTPAFFLLMVPVIAGFIEALVLALMPDARFDQRFNAGVERQNRSGWNAVLVAIVTLMVGTIVLLTTIALLFQAILDPLGSR